MNLSKYDKIWELLNKHEFDIESKLLNDLTCLICKKLLKNAQQSFCGCRYCLNCITDYLNDDEKCCPGLMDDCKEQTINIKRDVQMDHVANIRISKLLVKCPQTNCEFSDELRNIEDHLNSHISKCPYFDIGCNNQSIDNANMADHLAVEIHCHTALLMDSIQNFRNEIAFFKEDSRKKETINTSIMEQMAIISEMNAGQQELIEKLLKDVANYKTTNSKLNAEVTNLNVELAQIKKKDKKELERLTKLIERVAKIEQKMSAGKPQANKHDKTTEKDTTQGASVSSPKITVPRPKDESDDLPNGLIGMNPPNGSVSESISPFEWKIDNFRDRKLQTKTVVNSFITSVPFFSHENGYRMCLVVYPNGCEASNGAELGIGFHLLKGAYDDQLTWPMMRNVTISLIDQKTGAAHTSDTFNHAWTAEKNKNRFYKPTTLMNKARGTTHFINLNTLINNGRLCKNDSIVVRCTMDSIP